MSAHESRDGFFDLVNFKYDFTTGGLTQTGYFSIDETVARGTYYSGGSLTEPSSSSIRGIVSVPAHTSRYIFSDYCITLSGGGAQVPIYYLSTAPSATGLTKLASIVIDSVSNCNITLGSTIDVVIDGATTFKWRVNGGAYTTAVPITTAGVAVLIGGNPAFTVYFYTTAGFTVADTWSWKRTNFMRTAGVTGAIARPIEYELKDTSLYFLNCNLQMMRLGLSAASEPYAISVGTNPVYCNHFQFFEDHLFVFGYSATLPYDSNTSYSTSQHRVWANSDLRVYDMFFSTDVNEADSGAAKRGNYFLGCCVENSTLYYFTEVGTFYTNYLGLPNVVDFNDYTQFRAGDDTVGIAYWTLANCATPAQHGIYVRSIRDIWFFSGGQFTSRGRSLVYLNSSFLGFLPYVNPFNDDYSLYTNGKIYTLQVLFNAWYSQGAYFGTVFDTHVGCFWSSTETTCVGTASRVVLTSGYSFTAAPVYDNNGDYTVPTIILQSYVGKSFASVVECSSVYLAAASRSGSSSTYYTTGSALNLQLSWSTSLQGHTDLTGSLLVPDAAVATNASAVWNSGLTDGMVSFPRVAAHAIALIIKAVQVTTKPPGGCYVFAVEPLVHEATVR
jgi:hypothetical protein